MGHSHAHVGHQASNQRRLAITLALAAGYMLAEIAGGLLTNSLALLADAGHMFTDVAALSLSLFAIRVAQRPPTPQRTYGYHRTEILAALAHGAILVAVALFIMFEAVERIGEPREVIGGPMVAVAAGGLAVNALGLWILKPAKGDSLNIRGAWLHVLSDALGSVAAIAAGLLVWRFGWNWADPAASLLIGGLVIHASWALLREAVAVLMEGVPAHLDTEEIRSALSTLPDVLAVHDLHVWTIGTGNVSLSCHVVAEERRSASELLGEICGLLEARFAIEHVTIQIEPKDFDERRPCL